MNAEHFKQERATLSLQQAAVRYARLGWSVFPLHGKLPYKGTHGHKDATTDLETIRAWWSQHEAANIGLATGAVSGVIVLDIDPRHGGYFSLKDLERQYGKLTDTKTSSTANGGLHKFFQHPLDGLTYPNTVQLQGLKGIDVRGDGGYVVLPPSKLYNRLSYAWAKTDHPIAQLPAWLQQLLPVQQKDPVSPQPVGVALLNNHWLDQALKRAIQGNRDNTGF